MILDQFGKEIRTGKLGFVKTVSEKRGNFTEAPDGSWCEVIGFLTYHPADIEGALAKGPKKAEGK